MNKNKGLRLTSNLPGVKLVSFRALVALAAILLLTSTASVAQQAEKDDAKRLQQLEAIDYVPPILYLWVIFGGSFWLIRSKFNMSINYEGDSNSNRRATPLVTVLALFLGMSLGWFLHAVLTATENVPDRVRCGQNAVCIVLALQPNAVVHT